MARPRRLVFGALTAIALLGGWACSSSNDSGSPPAATPVGGDSASPDARTSTDAGAPDARRVLDSSCDARLAACPTTSSNEFSATIDPVRCGAPAYDQYNTGDGIEQADAVCNDFCAAANPLLAEAGSGTIICNQTVVEQAYGVGAFHCACAP